MFLPLLSSQQLEFIMNGWFAQHMKKLITVEVSLHPSDCLHYMQHNDVMRSLSRGFCIAISTTWLRHGPQTHSSHVPLLPSFGLRWCSLRFSPFEHVWRFMSPSLCGSWAALKMLHMLSGEMCLRQLCNCGVIPFTHTRTHSRSHTHTHTSSAGQLASWNQSQMWKRPNEKRSSALPLSVVAIWEFPHPCKVAETFYSKPANVRPAGGNVRVITSHWRSSSGDSEYVSNVLWQSVHQLGFQLKENRTVGLIMALQRKSQQDLYVCELLPSKEKQRSLNIS